MQSLLEALHSAGLFPRLVMPEMLALPYAAGRVSLLCDETTAWLRTAPYLGMAGERSMLPDMLALLREGNASPQLTCYVPEPKGKGESAAKLLELVKRSYPQVPVQAQPVSSVMDIMCGECLKIMRANGALNLLQGEFAPNAQSHFGKAWRKVGWIAAAWFVLQIGADLGQSAYFSYQAEQSRAEAATLYRKVFPSEGRIVDPARQMKAHLFAFAGESQGLLHILERLAAHWPTADAPLLMKSIAYRDDERQLTLSIEAKNMDTLNQLLRRVDGGGLNAGITSVVNGDNGVKGQLSVKETGQ